MSSQLKTAILTGASQGIGAGIVKAFVERGFNVVASSLKLTQSTEVAASDRVATAVPMITKGGLETVT
jgi:NAD(P)-dependent dehydrogenase (short-subunit alcohol dehydrogenase family)